GRRRHAGAFLGGDHGDTRQHCATVVGDAANDDAGIDLREGRFGDGQEGENGKKRGQQASAHVQLPERVAIVPEVYGETPCYFLIESMLSLPDPTADRYRKMKQYSTASSPPFWIGNLPCGACC